MFELSLPWWEFVVRGAISYIALLAMLRLTGKRSFGDMAPFDIVVLIILGGLLRPAVTGADHSLLGPLISIATILAVDKLLGKLAAISPAFDRLLEGRSVLLAKDGRTITDALRKHSVPQAAFERALRSQGVRDVAETQEVRLEANGHVTLMKADR